MCVLCVLHHFGGGGGEGWRDDDDDDDTVTCTPRTVHPKHPLTRFFAVLSSCRTISSGLNIYFSTLCAQVLQRSAKRLTSAADKACATRCSKKWFLLQHLHHCPENDRPVTAILRLSQHCFYPECAFPRGVSTLPVSAMPPNTGHVPGVLTLLNCDLQRWSQLYLLCSALQWFWPAQGLSSATLWSTEFDLRLSR